MRLHNEFMTSSPLPQVPVHLESTRSSPMHDACSGKRKKINMYSRLHTLYTVYRLIALTEIRSTCHDKWFLHCYLHTPSTHFVHQLKAEVVDSEQYKVGIATRWLPPTSGAPISNPIIFTGCVKPWSIHTFIYNWVPWQCSKWDLASNERLILRAGPVIGCQ